MAELCFDLPHSTVRIFIFGFNIRRGIIQYNFNLIILFSIPSQFQLRRKYPQDWIFMPIVCVAHKNVKKKFLLSLCSSRNRIPF
jgi:hypothetical protein